MQPTLSRAGTYRHPKTKTCARAGDYQPQKPKAHARAAKHHRPHFKTLHFHLKQARRPNDQAHPPPASHDQLPAEPESRKNDNPAGGRVQRLVVVLLICFARRTPTPRQSEQAAPADQADAANFRQKQPPSIGQSTAITMHPSKRGSTTPSSAAARPVRATKEPNRRVGNCGGCGRSAATTCCVALGRAEMEQPQPTQQLRDEPKSISGSKPKPTTEP